MIEADNLTYVFPDGTVGIHPTNFQFPENGRTLLIGANGGGKSTLLRVLAGKTLAKTGAVHVNGQDPFRDNLSGVTYLGTEWAANPIVRHDIPVVLLLSSVGGDAYPERRDLLVDILDIDLRWHMHAVSDGERRRVQLAMGLLKPWDTLLLDEVTVDLDVLVRSRLLSFLKHETEQRKCQVVYATHIFDGLTDWPTTIVHMSLGHILSVSPTRELIGTDTGVDSILKLALNWLQEDFRKRGTRKQKPTWDEIAPQVMANGPLERNTSDGFAKYFATSRARN